jgi:hypothetical protein
MLPRQRVGDLFVTAGFVAQPIAVVRCCLEKTVVSRKRTPKCPAANLERGCLLCRLRCLRIKPHAYPNGGMGRGDDAKRQA